MSLEDKTLARRDPEIKGLGTLLDETATLDILKQSFPDAGIIGAKKTYIRYKPGTSILVRYQLRYAGGELEIYAKAHGKQANEKLAKARVRQSIAGPLGPGRVIFTEKNIVVCSFPNDDKLVNLPRLFDTGLRNCLIERAMFDPERFKDSHISRLQYKPERRFVGKLESPSGQFAVIKLYTQTRFDAVAKTIRRSSPGDKFPSVIGISRKHRVLILDWVHGARLSDEYAASELALSWLRDAGKHLAMFHQMDDSQTVHRRSTRRFIDSLHQLSSGITHLIPSLTAWTQSLAQGLAQGVSSLTTSQTRIHGDFYAEQVLLTDQGVRFIDLDDICRWFPACDLGLFIAHLEWDSMRGTLTEELARLLEQALLEGYLRHNNCSLSEIHLFTAVGLMQLAHHPFRNCENNWTASIEALLTRCEARLKQFNGAFSSSQGGSSIFPGNMQADVTIEDLQMPFLPHIIDASKIDESLRQTLEPHYENIYSCSLEKPLIRRHKPGKRVLVEYIFKCGALDEPESTLSVLGKARAKGLDKRAWQLNRELFELGFNPASEDGIQVPEPLGAIKQHHMWLQRKIDGKNPFSMISAQDGKGTAGRVAEAIHKLHSSGITTERTHSLNDELDILENSITNVMQARPEWQQRLHGILTRSKQLAGEIPNTQPTGIHRDFYHDQILIDEDNLYLLDLDLYSMGDPALDVGNFVGHIQEQCLREFGNPHYASTSMQRFVDTYCELSGTDFHSTVDIYALLTMVRHIFISQRIENRRAYTGSIIDYCECSLLTAFN